MKKKQKNLIIWISFILVAFFIGLFILNNYLSSTQTFSYNSKDGIVDFKISSKPKLFSYLNIFSTEQTYLYSDTATVGESVKALSSYSFDCPRYQLTGAWFEVYKDGILRTSKQLNTGWSCSAPYFEVIQNVPVTEAGTWKVCDRYLYNDNGISKKLEYCDTVQVTATNTKPACVSFSKMFEGWEIKNYIKDSSGNTVGKVEQYHLIGIYTDCKDSIDKITQYRTVCNDGWVVSGTSSSISNGESTCEQKTIETTPIEDTTIPSYEGTAPGEIPADTTCSCEADVISNCPDGSPYLSKRCVECALIDSGVTCSAEQNKNITPPSVIVDDNKTISESSQINNYLIWIIVIIVFVIILYTLNKVLRKR